MIAMLLVAPTVTNAQSFSGDSDDVQNEQSMIRVGLWSNQPNIIAGANADFNLVDTATHELIGRFGAKDKVIISSRNGVIFVNNSQTAATSLTLLPDEAVGQEQLIEVNRHHYRGAIEFHRTHNKTGLTVVNTLSVEKYLYGVIPKEIPPTWHEEALKAQAVAARTYVLVSRGKFGDDGYDVAATIENQVYAGADCEALPTNSAVDETFGLVVTYQGRLISAVFHSSGGGYTENSENVWGTFTPYLRGVIDYDQKAPNYHWETQLTATAVDAALQRGGYHIGHIQAFEISHYSGQPEHQLDRGISGRVKNLRLIGTEGSVEITGSKLRKLLALHSTLFDIHIMIPTKTELEFSIMDGYGREGTKTVPTNLPLFPARKAPGDGDNIQRLLGDPTELIVINGYGYGHGLGLSQWGAKAMADKAPPGDRTYFKQILKHYYQGVDITKLY
jgi:stage II sporulation protein D